MSYTQSNPDGSRSYFDNEGRLTYTASPFEVEQEQEQKSFDSKFRKIEAAMANLTAALNDLRQTFSSR